jgi:hypothetical protein
VNVFNLLRWLFLVVGAYKLYSDCVFFTSASRCAGRFKGWAPGNAEIVIFTTMEGKEIEFTSKISLEPRPRLKIGDPIEVLYDPAEPENARIYRFLLFWLMAFGLITFGLCFVICL